MKKLLCLAAFSMFFSTSLDAKSTSLDVKEKEKTRWDCHLMAEAGAQAVDGDRAEQYQVYAAVYEACLDTL